MNNKILVLDNYDSFTYNLVHYIESSGEYEVDVFRNDEITLDEIDKYETIVLSPGPGLPENAGVLKEVIRKHAPHKKMLGVCLGMQAIGEVFGGELENLAQVYHGVSTELTVVDANDPLYFGLPQSFQMGRYHSWIISNENFPKELIVTARDENNQVMSLRHVTYKLYGVQFHPESVLTEYGKELIDNFLNIK
ncbi:aminodeoxychorismate/anthranilate synthase component II [Brumimicrobium glaciale]|uniref:Aminodeoxychorismate/anthranilate synthase component II n=1 Tax=Brumimicrobium glaciale TaxID=200475 RepID=A0A4Q4KNH5_9FLAO|nr:aminodeoxychorismate/anthranilate synthase component II [Brumimicrobium glaciale]RYM33479.1 aminodeoxychorismate/anthranilate synthase component II [Brumimicrobium glaciale]